MQNNHSESDADSTSSRRLDVYFPVTPRLDSEARVILMKDHARTLLEAGSITTNADAAIVLYDVLRYFTTKTPTADGKTVADLSMTLLRETLTLIDVISHGHKGPLPISAIESLLSESVDMITDLGLSQTDVYLNPDTERRRYFGARPATWATVTLKECIDTLGRWTAYVQWCEDEKVVERIRIRELDDQIRRGMIPTKAAAGGRGNQDDLIRAFEARSQYLRYKEEQERNERIAQLMTQVLTSRDQPSHPPPTVARDPTPTPTTKTIRYTGPKLKATIPIISWIIVFERISETEGYSSDTDRLKLLPKALETDDEAIWSWYSSISNGTSLTWSET